MRKDNNRFVYIHDKLLFLLFVVFTLFLSLLTTCLAFFFFLCWTDEKSNKGGECLEWVFQFISFERIDMKKIQECCVFQILKLVKMFQIFQISRNVFSLFCGRNVYILVNYFVRNIILKCAKVLNQKIFIVCVNYPLYLLLETNNKSCLRQGVILWRYFLMNLE